MQREQAKIFVQVQPNAKKDEIVAFEDGILKVKISTPPVKGKANKQLIEFLSKTMKIPKSDIAIEKGATSRRKKVVIDGLTQSQLMQKLPDL